MWKVDLTAYVEKHEFCFDAVLDENVTNDEVIPLLIEIEVAKLIFMQKEILKLDILYLSLLSVLQLVFSVSNELFPCLLQQVYHETVEPIIPIIFQRTKATCFAYGQTGA